MTTSNLGGGRGGRNEVIVDLLDAMEFLRVALDRAVEQESESVARLLARDIKDLAQTIDRIQCAPANESCSTD